MSKVASLAELPASEIDSVAISAIGAPRVMTWSIEESCCSFAVSVVYTAEESVPLT